MSEYKNDRYESKYEDWKGLAVTRCPVNDRTVPYPVRAGLFALGMGIIGCAYIGSKGAPWHVYPWIIGPATLISLLFCRKFFESETSGKDPPKPRSQPTGRSTTQAASGAERGRILDGSD